MTDFVLDTFTGSGNLGSHTGETGATWSATGATGYSGVPGPSDAVLNGVGGFTSDECGISPSGTPPTSEYFIELDIQLLGGTDLYLDLLFRENGGTFYDVYLECNAAAAYAQVTKRTGGGYSNLSDHGLGATYSNSFTISETTIHTFRLEVTDATKTLYFDAAMLFSTTDNSITSGSDMTLYMSGLEIWPSNVARFQAGTLVDIPDPVVGFWTDLELTTQVYA